MTIRSLLTLSLLSIISLTSSGCAFKEPKVIVKDKFVKEEKYPFEIVPKKGLTQELKPVVVKNVELVDDVIQSKTRLGTPIGYIAINKKNNSILISAKGVQRFCSGALYNNDMIHKPIHDDIIRQIEEYKSSGSEVEDINSTKGDK